ncbi:MAG: hypothetical protein CMH59_19205, partial [Myxococcales bacterium]|nr:hypothetical protein [Myxococcales bacterium]
MEERSERDRGAEVRPGRERGVALLGGLIALGGALAAGAWLWSAGSPEERRFRPPTEAPEPERIVAFLEAPGEGAVAEAGEEAPAGEAATTREEVRTRAVRQAGALGVLEGRAGSWNGPTSPFGREEALGQDPMEALGGLMGGATGGAQAPGALGLRGTGRGGGGAGAGYGGLGVHGAIGGGAGAPAALGRSGVLASNFVAGSGVRTRLRDLLDRGVEIDGEHVRLEAFQERAALSYPVPARDAVALYAEAERARVRAAGDVVHLQIALVGRRGERPARPPLDVRLVLDRSGSMEGEKWAHAVDAAERLVERLRPRDRFALVTYDDEARLDVPPRRVGDGRAIVRTLRGLAPGGGTNIGAALELVRAHPPERRAGGVGMVMLLSDGEATTGVTDARSLGGLARRVFDETGALVTTVGVGTRFDEATMLAMAREGSGSYHFVARPSDVPRILADELEERAQAVAQALRVRVELAPGVVARKVYGSRLLAEGEAATVRRTERRLDARLEAELGIVA